MKPESGLDSLQTSLDMLKARNEISETLYRYCYFFDSADVDGLRTLFTDDAVVDYGPEMGPLVGIELIMGSISAGLHKTFAATSHHLSNLLIDIHADGTASSRSYLYAWHRYQNKPEIGYLWGQYRHELRFDDGQWKISSLKLFAVASQDFHRSKMHQISRAI